MTQIKVYWLLLLVFWIHGLEAEPLFFENSTVLAEHGFENIYFSRRDAGDVAVYYENRVYRDELYAAGVITALLHEQLPDSIDIILIPGRRALPICQVRIDRASYSRYIADSKGSPEAADFVTVGDVQQASPFWRRHFERPSFGKIDLTVYPTFSVYLGNYDDRFKLFFAVMPVMSTTLWKGASAYVEMSIPMYNDVNYQYFRFIDYPQLSKAAVNQIVRLPLNIMASTSFGVYNPNRWGWAGEVNRAFFNRRLSLGYSFEYTGFLLYYDHVWHYSKTDLTTSKAYAIYYSDFLNCQFGVSYNRYVMKDSGPLFEFSRNFHESTVGVFAGKTQVDKFGGIALRFPLGRFKKRSPGVVRVKLPRYYEYSYRATNKVYTQHSPVQSGIAVYTGTKLSYLDMHLRPNYVANNKQIFLKAFHDVHSNEEGSGEEEYLLYK